MRVARRRRDSLFADAHWASFLPLGTLTPLVDNTGSLTSLWIHFLRSIISRFLLFLLLLQLGSTPLHTAARKNRLNAEIVCDLVAAGANPDIKNNVSAPPTPQSSPSAGVECPLARHEDFILYMIHPPRALPLFDVCSAPIVNTIFEWRAARTHHRTRTRTRTLINASE